VYHSLIKKTRYGPLFDALQQLVTTAKRTVTKDYTQLYNWLEALRSPYGRENTFMMLNSYLRLCDNHQVCYEYVALIF